MAMVHRLFRHRLLVLHGCMVVSKMTLRTCATRSIRIPLLFYSPFIYHAQASNLYIQPKSYYPHCKLPQVGSSKKKLVYYYKSP